MKTTRYTTVALCVLILSGCVGYSATEADLHDHERTRRSLYLHDFPDTPPKIADAIRIGAIEIGMTGPQVQASMGRPSDRDEKPGGQVVWEYDERFVWRGSPFDRDASYVVTFRDGRVTAVDRQ